METQPVYDILTALLYVRANPGVPIRTFVTHHSPIGNVLWTELWYQDYLTMTQENTLLLSPTGEELLNVLLPEA